MRELYIQLQWMMGMAKIGPVLAGKDLGEIDHPLPAPGEADAGEPEIAFDIPPMAGAVEPAIHYFPGGHLSGSHVLRYYPDRAHFLVEISRSLVEPLMAERRSARSHIPAMLFGHRRFQRIDLKWGQSFGAAVLIDQA